MSGRNGFNFLVGFNQLANSVAEYNVAMAQSQSRRTSFIRGEYANFDNGQTNAECSGHLWLAISRVGLRVSPDTTICILSRYRSGKASSDTFNTELNCAFWGGGGL